MEEDGFYFHKSVSFCCFVRYIVDWSRLRQSLVRYEAEIEVAY